MSSAQVQRGGSAVLAEIVLVGSTIIPVNCSSFNALECMRKDSMGRSTDCPRLHQDDALLRQRRYLVRERGYLSRVMDSMVSIVHLSPSSRRRP